MKKNIKVSVIIPNWNGRELLGDCLTSLQQQTYDRFETIVVDNGSTDNSVEYIENNFTKVKVIKLRKNYGFARAINDGVKASSAEYVVFLNNDTQADPEWLKKMVRMADVHSEAASVGCKILNFYKRKIIDGVGICINEVGQARSIGWQERDLGQYDNLKYVFGVTAGAALFRRKIFIRVGLFDEGYFMYSEEVDWAFRAQFLGYKSIFCPEAIVYHKHKMSSRKKPQHLEYWQFRNMTQTIIKDMPLEIILQKWRWLKMILVHFNTIFYQIRNGFFWSPFLVEIWLLIHLPMLLTSRYKIQSNRIVDSSYIEQFITTKRITFWGLMK